MTGNEFTVWDGSANKSYTREDILALIAEVEQLRTERDAFKVAGETLNQWRQELAKENATLREIVREILDAAGWLTGWDGSPVEDWPDGLLDRARAILAAKSEGSTDGQ